MKANHAAFEIAQLADRMAQGYFAHSAAISVAMDPRAMALVPKVLAGMNVPLGTVRRKDSTEHSFHFTHFLKLAATNAEVGQDFSWIWLAGALLKIGDALSRHNYFDRAPELELVRHLRNGIAHGNRFRIDNPASLQRFPAHNRKAWVRSDKKTIFEITPNLTGDAVLFDYLGAGDVLDILMSISIYLSRMGTGDPLRLPPNS